MNLFVGKQVISKAFYFTIGVVGFVASVAMLYKEGLSVLAVVCLLGSLGSVIISWREKIVTVRSIPLADVQKDKDAIPYHDEWDDDIYVVPATEFQTITSDMVNYIGYQDALLALKLPLQTLEDHLRGFGFRRFSKVYWEAGGYCTPAKNSVAYDGLIIRSSEDGMVDSIFWNTFYAGTDAESNLEIREALRSFTKEYPLIMVHFAPGQIDCLNGSHITGVDKWKHEPETVWRCPNPGCDGYVSYVNDGDEAFYGCGEDGVVWHDQQTFFGAIDRIVASYPHRSECYIKEKEGWSPNPTEPSDMEELIHQEIR